MRLRRHKYGARRVELDGYKFDSKAEARRYRELKLLEKAGKIESLAVHPPFRISHGGMMICVVKLDFLYLDKQRDIAVWVYEDVKGVDTPMSRLKRKLVLAFYGIVVEVIHR